MPPLDFGYRMRRRNGERQRDSGSRAELSKSHQNPSRWTAIVNIARYQRRMTCK
jgi:hypothetical protein